MADEQRYAFVVFDGETKHLLGSMMETACGLTWRTSDIVPESWQGITLDAPGLCAECRIRKGGKL